VLGHVHTCSCTGSQCLVHTSNHVACCAADEPDDEANEAEQQAQLQAEVEDMFELEGKQQQRHHCSSPASSGWQ
jgi:hypothetical protein